MAYIGKQPVVGNFQKCDAISVVNGQAAYTLNVGGAAVSPENANHMLVSLNGVLQAPGDSFTVSGSTLTFASNLATGDVIDFVIILGDVLDLGTPSDNSITTAKLASDAVTEAKIADDAVESEHLNNNIISGQTALGATPADTDELLVSDAGTLKRVDFSHLKGGGAFELITTTTISSAVSSVDFTSTHITTTYRDYRIIASGLIGASDDVKFALMFSTGGDGSSYRTDSDHDYAFSNINSDDNNHQYETDVNQGLVYISGAATQGNATGESGSFIADIFDPLNQTSDNSFLHGIASGCYRDTGGVLIHFKGSFGISDSGLEDTVFNGIRVKYSSGNIAQGTVSLYGRKI